MSCLTSFIKQIYVKIGTLLIGQAGQKIANAAKDLITNLGKKLIAYVDQSIQSGTQHINEKIQTTLDNHLAPKLTKANTTDTVVENDHLVPAASIIKDMVSFEKEKLLSSSKLPLLSEVIPATTIISSTSPTAALAA